MDIIVVVRRANIGRPICNHLLGKEHSHGHRMAVGAVIMAAGVTIAKATGHHELEVVAYVGDAVGYAIHGLGLTPYAEYLLSKFAE